MDENSLIQIFYNSNHLTKIEINSSYVFQDKFLIKFFFYIFNKWTKCNYLNLYNKKIFKKAFNDGAHIALQNWWFFYFFKILSIWNVEHRRGNFAKITPWRKNQVIDFCAKVSFTNIYGNFFLFLTKNSDFSSNLTLMY